MIFNAVYGVYIYIYRFGMQDDSARAPIVSFSASSFVRRVCDDNIMLCVVGDDEAGAVRFCGMGYMDIYNSIGYSNLAGVRVFFRCCKILDSNEFLL